MSFHWTHIRFDGNRSTRRGRIQPGDSLREVRASECGRPLWWFWIPALVDSHVVKLAEARLLSHAVAVPKFINDELHELAISLIDDEKNRGVRGLNTISELKKMDHIDLRVIDSELDHNVSRDEKILFIVSSSKGRLLTTSEGLQ